MGDLLNKIACLFSPATCAAGVGVRLGSEAAGTGVEVGARVRSAVNDVAMGAAAARKAQGVIDELNKLIPGRLPTAGEGGFSGTDRTLLFVGGGLIVAGLFLRR